MLFIYKAYQNKRREKSTNIHLPEVSEIGQFFIILFRDVIFRRELAVGHEACVLKIVTSRQTFARRFILRLDVRVIVCFVEAYLQGFYFKQPTTFIMIEIL